MDSATPDAPAGPKPEDREWSPRIWLGCDYFAWHRLLWLGRFNFHLWHLHIGVIASTVSFGHMVLRWAHHARYGRAIARTPIDKPPIFILGHWRTGTTLLHEMMILDPRHGYPNNYHCLDPNHVLLTEEHFKKWFKFLLPQRRPMDNMELNWDRPQEDEFALCMLGQPSPYLDIAFPNRMPLTPEAMDLDGMHPYHRKQWQMAFYRFLQMLTYRDPRRIVLKSPPHTCRIPTLLEMFPDARFVHIMRDPYVVFPSTVNLWKSLYFKQGLQWPNYQGIKERVFESFNHMYARLEEGQKLIPRHQFHELRYEDLTRDPVGQMHQLYKALDLGNFDEHMRPGLLAFLDKTASYETNKYTVTEEQREEITRRWGRVIERYGYGENEDSSVIAA